jgi:hypothetical protein
MLPESTLRESIEDRNKENAIHRASIVMLCSHVEGYVEDILEEFVGNIKSIGATSSNIPCALKVELCRPGLILLNNNDHNVLRERIPEFIEKYEEFWFSAERIQPELFPEFEKKDWQMGNPWPDAIDAYLKRIGIEGFWDETNSTVKGDLDTLVQKRNLIAHGHFQATATHDDIKRYIISIVRLVKLLDRRIETHQILICQ